MPEFEFSARPPAQAADFAVLDQPTWTALTTEQHALALGSELARRFPAEIGPLSALREQSGDAYDDLRALAGNGPVAQFLREPWEPRAGWSSVHEGPMDQMVWAEEIRFTHELPPKALLRELSEEDAPAMLALAKQTEPGPFGTRTHTLGQFFGIFESGTLMAMAGQRLHMPGFTELSAVCTHPETRGRGYARVLMAQVMADILRRGKIPMLHVLSANEGAIRVYRGLGFTLRRKLHLAVLKVAER